MAERVRYVDTASTAGGNGTVDTTSGANRAYVSMQAAETAETDNFDTDNDWLHVLCRSSVGGDDTTALSVSGSTTSATDYMMFEGNGEFYRHAVTNNFAIQTPDEYIRFKRIHGSLSMSDSTNRAYFTPSPSGGGNALYLERMKFQEIAGGGSGAAVGLNNDDADTICRMSNCWFWDWQQGAARGYRFSVGTLYSYHVVCQNCDTGHYDGGGTVVVINGIAKGCTDGFLGTFDGATNYNASDIASDAPGANSVTGSVTFVDEGADDFHLATGDTVAKGVGIDLSADANYPIAEDIDGLAYASWDGVNMGSDQFEESGAPAASGGFRSLLGVGR